MKTNKADHIRINLGTAIMPRDTYNKLKSLGLSRKDIKEIIVNAGISYADDSIFSLK